RNQMIEQKNPQIFRTTETLSAILEEETETLIAILEEEDDYALNQNLQNRKSKSSTQNVSSHHEKGGTLPGPVKERTPP
ncbi:hypothetical protein VIGAN_07187500, partial [Vigna angularis var. angularis]